MHPLLVAVLHLTAAQVPHPGTQNAQAALHEDLMRSTSASRALLPMVSTHIAGQTQQHGFSFGDDRVKVNAAHTSPNNCVGTIYSFWASTLLKRAAFGAASFWVGLGANGVLEDALTNALNTMVARRRNFTLEEYADAVTEQLEPYRNTALYTRMQAYLFTLQVLSSLTGTLPTSRFSTKATFRVDVTHTPLIEPARVKNRFDLVSRITTETSVRTAGIVECYAWYMANVYAALVLAPAIPEEVFYVDTRLGRRWVPAGQAALTATVIAENEPQVVAGELTLRPRARTITGAPRDHYFLGVYQGEVPDTLRFGGSNTQFELQASRHLTSVLEQLEAANYDGHTVQELLLLNDRLDADTFFQKSDVTGAARFNLDPARGTQREQWLSPATQLGFVTGGTNLGSLASLPSLLLGQLAVGPVNASPISPALNGYASALVTPEASLVASAQKSLHALRGLENELFTNPLSSAHDDFDTTVLAGLGGATPIFDLQLRGKVLAFVAPPRVYEQQGKRFVEVMVSMRLHATSVERSISAVQTGDVTFTTEVREEYFKLLDEQRADRSDARWELRLVPGATQVTTTLDATPMLAAGELEMIISELLHPRLSRAIQGTLGNRVGNLHDLGGWGGLQSMVRHQLQQQWLVNTDGPAHLSGLKLTQPSHDLVLDFGARAPRPYPATPALNAAGDAVTVTTTEHVPANAGVLPRVDYAVRQNAAGEDEPFVVACNYSFQVPNGALPPVTVHTSYSYGVTRLLRGDKRQVLTDAQYFNADAFAGAGTVGLAKLGATNSNIARRIFDESNPLIPDICKIRPEDRIYYVSNFAPGAGPDFDVAVYGEYDRGLEKSPECNPLMRFARVPYLPRTAQPMPIAPGYTATFLLTGAAAARKHVTSAQSCANVGVLTVSAGGGGGPTSSGTGKNPIGPIPTGLE